ncbi:hypothetical protein LWI29_006903 [Acer saccharum]|uniref:Beta-galactosidase n=1 Tax=Acer saccharum TaxID=4024 RepID=A0AA39SR05_ACESA|nr:hypothetical protein LWI29_006903 [Acer saccharum]
MSRSGGPIGSHSHTCSSTAESTAAKPKLSARMRKRSTKMTVFFTVLVLLLAFGGLVPVFAPLPSLSSHKSPHHHHHYKKMNVGKFEIDEDMFWKDGHPFQIIGGDLHYFRVLPEYWEDRLLRAKAMGLNTIQTYVPWNLHEPKPGKLVFKGIADLVSFLKLCQKLDLLVMLRARPYICAEWDLGGFPAWLLAIKPALKLRSSDPAFLQLVEKWWGVLLPKTAPLLYNNGGPVVMVQIENEFGSYGDDKVYLHHLVTLAKAHLGEDIILYTTDGGSRENLEKGTIKGDAVFSAPSGDEPEVYDLLFGSWLKVESPPKRTDSRQRYEATGFGGSGGGSSGSKGSHVFGGTARPGKRGDELGFLHHGQPATARKLVVGTSSAVGPPTSSVSDLGRDVLTSGRDSRKQSAVEPDLVGLTTKVVNVARNLGEEFEKEELPSVIPDTAGKEKLSPGFIADNGKEELTSVITTKKPVVDFREASVKVDWQHVGDKPACASSSVSANSVDIGPSLAHFDKEIVGLKMHMDRDEGFSEMEMDSRLALNISQNVSDPGVILGETEGAGLTVGPKVGKWKRRARDGSRFDSVPSSETHLGKRGCEGRITQEEKKLKLYTNGVGLATAYDDISAGLGSSEEGVPGGRHEVRRKVATTSPAKITASSKEKRGLHDVHPPPAKSAAATTDGNDVALRSPPRSPPTSEPTASDLPLKRRRFGVATTFAAH